MQPLSKTEASKSGMSFFVIWTLFVGTKIIIIKVCNENEIYIAYVFLLKINEVIKMAI